MRTFLGIPTVNYVGTANLTNTSVVQTDGPGGASSKVLNQAFPVNGGSNYGSPSTGTGITLAAVPLAGGPVEEATIEFDFRAKSAGVPWGWGGKIPGLAGIKPGAGSPPSGGSPTADGWSGRLMFRRQGGDTTNLLAKLVGYLYLPLQTADTTGLDVETGKFLVANQWHKLKQYYKMNTVTSEGTGVANGVHRIWLDGVLCYESTTTVFRVYQEAMITHMQWSNFYGGADAAWGPTSDTNQQFDNLVITTF